VPDTSDPSRKSWVGASLVLGAAVLWGTTGTAQTLAPEDVGSVSVGAARMLFGAGALLLLSLRRGIRSLTADFRSTAVLPALAMVGYQLCFFAAVRKTGVAVGTAVALGTAPVITGSLAWMFLKERPTTSWFIATPLALLGCIFLMVLGRHVDADPIGIVLALGAGLSYAGYVITTKDLVAETSPFAATTATFSLAALLMLPLLLVGDLAWLFAGRGLLVALHLGVIATALAYLLFSEGITRTPVATATTFSLAEPVTAVLLATIVVGEQLTPTSIAGVALVMSGLVLLTLDAARGGEKRRTAVRQAR
jgi:DME family drug/metabolite transporter